jgi:hypothetical protein
LDECLFNDKKCWTSIDGSSWTQEVIPDEQWWTSRMLAVNNVAESVLSTMMLAIKPNCSFSFDYQTGKCECFPVPNGKSAKVFKKRLA